jgi:hypothetical protein
MKTAYVDSLQLILDEIAYYFLMLEAKRRYCKNVK